jgi:hypothetical protein
MNGVGGEAGWRWMYVPLLSPLCSNTLTPTPQLHPRRPPYRRGRYRLLLPPLRLPGHGFFLDHRRARLGHAPPQIPRFPQLRPSHRRIRPLRVEIRRPRPHRLAAVSLPLHVLGHRLPALRHQLVPPNHHQRPRLHGRYRPAPYRPDLHHCRRLVHHSVFLLRQSGEAGQEQEPVYFLAHGGHFGRVHYGDCREREWWCARGGVCGGVHRYLRHLSCVSREYCVD